MEQVTTIGLDTAKHVFQLHGADAAGQVPFRWRVTPRVIRRVADQIARMAT